MPRLVFGFTFKENTPDTRNTRIIDIYNELKEYEIKPLIYDPVADIIELKEEYNMELNKIEEMKNLDVIIFAVNHKEFQKITNEQIEKMFKEVDESKRVIIDIKGVLNRKYFENKGYSIFRL